ncbi:MAG: TorD/DmsD family molecular chaperone, partial [Syntrophales bacterium]
LHGSTCREKKGATIGERISEMLCFFREAGFTPNRGDIPGHIAHQLEFMSVLAEQESQASREERIRLEEIQLNFLSRFLITGASAYCEKVTKQNCFPFYCILGDLTREFISFEINYLGIPEEKEQVDSYKRRGS